MRNEHKATAEPRSALVSSKNRASYHTVQVIADTPCFFFSAAAQFKQAFRQEEEKRLFRRDNDDGDFW